MTGNAIACIIFAAVILGLIGKRADDYLQLRKRRRAAEARLADLPTGPAAALDFTEPGDAP